MNRFINITSLFFLIGILFSCNEGVNIPKEETTDFTVYETLQKDSRYSTLIEALEITGLNEELNQANTNITLFAPTNEAFAQLIGAGVGGGIEQMPKNKLKQMLLGHIVKGLNRSKDLYSGYYPSQAKKGSNKKNLSIYMNTINNNVVLNGYSTVMQKDIIAKNGIIHSINKVLEPTTLWALLKADHQLTDLFENVERSSLANQIFTTLNFNAPITFFAPSNKALEKISAEDLNLLYHITRKENLCSAKKDLNIVTLNGRKITIKFKKDRIVLIDEMNKSSELLFQSIQAVNGELHIINDVLTPKS